VTLGLPVVTGPVFKLCFRSSERFLGVCDLGATGVAAAVDRHPSAVVLVAAAVGHSLRSSERPTSPRVPS
jgi:hypothetical protein